MIFQHESYTLGTSAENLIFLALKCCLCFQLLREKNFSASLGEHPLNKILSQLGLCNFFFLYNEKKKHNFNNYFLSLFLFYFFR